MNIIDTEKNKILMWNEGVEVDAFAMEQLRNLANHPFLHRHVAVMPDAHAGMGATIGSVFCADSAVIPSAVGVDIGCGMMLQQTGKLIDEALLADLPRIKQDILKWIPVGFRHQKVLRKAYRVGTLTELQSRFEAQRADPEFDPQSMEGIEYLNYIDPDSIKSRVPRLVLAAQDEMVSMLSDDLLAVLRRYPDLMNGPHPIHQVGSLGGGNHFIELCRNRADELVTAVNFEDLTAGLTTEIDMSRVGDIFGVTFDSLDDVLNVTGDISAPVTPVPSPCPTTLNWGKSNLNNLRKFLKMKRLPFAEALCVKLSTLEAWEEKRRRISAAAQNRLDTLAHDSGFFKHLEHKELAATVDTRKSTSLTWNRSNFLKLRKRLNLTREQLAAHLLVKLSTLGRWESRRLKITPAALNRINQAAQDCGMLAKPSSD